MPIARFEMPDGRIARFEVAEGTTPEQAQAQIAEMVSSQDVSATVDPTLTERIGGGIKDIAEVGLGNLEAAATIATGAIAEPIAGFAGLLGAALPGEEGQGAEFVKATQDALTFQPKTEEGKERIGQVADVASILPEIAKPAGELAFDITGSPEAATGVESFITVLPDLIGLGILKKMRVGTKLLDDTGRPTKQLRKALDKQGLVYDNLTPQAKATIPAIADQSFISGQPLVPATTQLALVEQIKSGGRGDALSGLAVVGDTVVPHKAGIEAARQGFAPGFIQSIKTFTPETRRQAKKSLNIARRIKDTERVGLDIRPGDIVGDAVTKRLRFLRDSSTDARKELNQIAGKRLAGKTIDPNLINGPLSKALDDLDVVLDDTKPGRFVVDFSDSIISKDKGSQRAINDAIDLLFDAQSKGSVNALKAHKLKRQLDNIIDFNKKAASGLGEDGRNVLKTVRRALNDSVRTVDPDYARVNDVMSKSLTALDDFDKASGAAIDIFGPGANSAIGTKMRGLTSNIQNRVNLENSIFQLDKVAQELMSPKPGKQVAIVGKERPDRARRLINLNDDIKDLAMFANAMDARFGAVAKTGITGAMESAFNRVLNQGMSQEIMQQGANVVGKQANKLRGISEFNAFESMEELLK